MSISTRGRHRANVNNGKSSHPHRNQSSGSIDLNRHIKATFRSDTLRFARSSNEGPPFWNKFRMIQPRGAEQITYGDKVICIRNHGRAKLCVCR